MPKYYKNSDELLVSIKRRAVVPESQNLFSNQDLLDFATEEIDSHVVQLINTQQENYFLVSLDVPIVPGQSRYEIPYRATGNKLKDLAYIPNNDNTRICKMTEIDMGQLPEWNQSYKNSEAYAYFTSSNEVCLVPETNNFVGTLRFSFYLRTNSLVPMDEVGTITAIDTNTGIVTVNEIPEKFTVTDLYDFVMERSPHKIITYDNPVTSVNTGTGEITFGVGNLPSTLRVGDLVCVATETGIPNVPSDLHNLICHRAAARVFEAVGDTEALQTSMVKSQQLDASAANLVDNRVETSAKKIVNSRGLIRSTTTTRFNRRGWR